MMLLVIYPIRNKSSITLEKLAHKFPRLKKILADGGYRGDGLKDMVRKKLGCQLAESSEAMIQIAFSKIMLNKLSN